MLVTKPYLLLAGTEDGRPQGTQSWVRKYYTREEAEKDIHKFIGKFGEDEYLIEGDNTVYSWVEVVNLATWK